MQTSTSLRLEAYASAARSIAFYLAPQSAAHVDATANDRHDYQAVLLATAWHAKEKFQKLGVQNALHEARWVRKSMWNKARGLVRRRPVDRPVPAGDEINTYGAEAPHPDAQIEAKQVLQLLAAQMDPRDWVLLQSAASETMTRTEKLAATGLTRSDFHRRVQKARETASRILERAGVDSLGLFSGRGVITKHEDDGVVSVSRKTLTREADRLGLPYTDATTEVELNNLIEARNAHEGQDMQSTLPKMPDCFGIYWDGASHDDCKRCAVNPQCLVKFAAEKLPSVSGTVSEMAGDLGVSVASVEFAQSYNESRLAAGAEPVADLAPIPPPPALPIQELEVETPEEVPQAPPAPTPVAQEPVAEAEAPKRKKAAKKTKAKATEESGKATAPVNPRRAGVATPAAPPARKRAKSARTAQASVRSRRKKKKGVRTPHKWGQHTWKARRERERERHPEIGRLTPGCKLSRDYQGKMYVALVKADHYALIQAGAALPTLLKFPTLQSLTDHITGVKKYPKQKGANGRRPPGFRYMSNWSASRFFNLKRLLLAS